MFTTDTIAAISTGTMGSGGIGIIRISGDEAIEVADRLSEASQAKTCRLCKPYNTLWDNSKR